MYVQKKKNWDEICKSFQWTIPDKFNVAHEACDKWAKKQPKRTALLEYHNGEVNHISYGHIAEQSKRLANVLVGRGCKKGDRIAILLPQSAETVVAHIAIYRIGAIALPLAMLFGPDAIKHRLKHAEAGVVITNGEGLNKINAIKNDLKNLHSIFCADGKKGDAIDLKKNIREASDESKTVITTKETPALMVFTSGTTGPPKGALHAQRVFAAHIPAVTMLHEFTPKKDDRFWTPADWAWAGGLLNILMPGLMLGVPVAFSNMKKFDPQTAFEIMETTKIKNIFAPPTALKIMREIKNPKKKYDLCLRTVFGGGEALGQKTYQWGKEQLGVTINEGYGQTEANLVITSCAKIGVTKPNAMGKQSPGAEVEIIREDGSVCQCGEVGQIAVKNNHPIMFLKYWKQPDETKNKFIKNWMVTGDQGTKDKDGYFQFFGRDDDVITSAGFRIGPGEIEDCIIGHKDVKLAAAVGKPDKLRTEIVKCYVVLQKNVRPTKKLKQEIQKYVRTKLSAHEYPREIEFIKNMPLTTTGKVIRREFRQKAKNEAEQKEKTK